MFLFLENGVQDTDNGFKEGKTLLSLFLLSFVKAVLSSKDQGT